MPPTSTSTSTLPSSKDGKPRPSLLAPIVLSTPKPRVRATNGSTTKRKPNPNPSANLPSMEPSVTSSRRTSKLEEMEPPPVIPAAVEEQGYRSRPVSSHSQSLRWKEEADEMSDGYFTSRRGSDGTASTTVWADQSPEGASAPGPSSSTKARRRRGGIFRTESDSRSHASADGGDEMEQEQYGTVTPNSRRSTTFPYPMRASGDYSGTDDLDTPIDKRRGFFSRFRRLGGGGNHARSLSGYTVGSDNENEQGGDDDPDRGPYTPETPYSAGVVDEGAESEDLPRRRRSFSPAPHHDGSMSAPATPRLGSFRPLRRATVASGGEESPGQTPGRREGMSRRASLRHRISRRSSRDGERPPYLSTHRWRALKAGIKMIGRKAKDKDDQKKSAELVAELSAGTPAALILASMFQRDEHGHRRIPILLEQLKVRITESQHSQKGGRHQTLFKLELEYGSGLTRMQWVIWRDFRDFLNLHTRYRVSSIGDQTFGGTAQHKLPKFPRESIPYLRGVRGLGSDEEDGADGDASGAEGLPHPPRPRRRPFARRVSSNVDQMREGQAITAGLAAGFGAAAAAGGGTTVQTVINRHQGYARRQREQLEEYMRRLISMMVFRADSNRLCKFLELSALGVRLAAEGTYHGKEGYLIIKSSKGSDFRRPWNPGGLAKRHSPKWFLVRHSYIVCVDSPEEMNIYDVFLVDSNFTVDTSKFLRKTPGDLSIAPSNPRPQHHTLTIANSERTLKLLAKHERQLMQFRGSIQQMKSKTLWARPQRFESFAPVRRGVFAQWLVDGRDYFWNVSRAISMAKDVIYIHDWWLSPELYLRRPAAVSQKWRLDRLLQRKAQEGVKVFVIVYRNIGAAIPIDSSYTKYSLLDLHPNVYVQRSPNQIRQQTFFWAHHEKILIVDHMIAFVGGLDLCFGRWDTPQHSVVDDKPSGFEEGSMKNDPDNFQLWPGKDYSNPRVQDFFNLDKPYDDMYDRKKVPRMPWHDIHMQVVGQPARDLTRHFVQRWNYLLRQRTPSRPTPLLLPQPDFAKGELESLGVDGTCEVQILRSACNWSMGTPGAVEDSIQRAYLKSIELSEHLVYIENQFFITSCEFEGTRIENKIGDALVERITRAYHNDEDWRAIIIIPLMPGFQNAIDAQDGTSVRLIMHCQFRSISQGESSIFGRLRAKGIEPEDYIHFFSLRNWGKIGPDQKFVTEQLYIHAKCMIVDDRIAIIGSANINERSMLGTRDSEVAAIVRDTDAIDSTMAGRPYKVGRFPHTLRVRLMREHLGVDVDAIMQEEMMEEAQRAEDEWDAQIRQWEVEGARGIKNSATPQEEAPAREERRQELDSAIIERLEKLRSFNHDVDWEQENNPNLKARKKGNQDSRISGNAEHRADVRGFGTDQMVRLESERASMSVERDRPKTPEKGRRRAALLSSLRGKDSPSSLNSPISKKSKSPPSSGKILVSNIEHAPLPPPPVRASSYELGLPQLSQLPPLPQTSDVDIGGPLGPEAAEPDGTLNPNLPHDFVQPKITPDMFVDPLNEEFYYEIWHKVAKYNTELYRRVFRCQPDNEVKTWATYKEVIEYAERFEEAQNRHAAQRKGEQQQQDPENEKTHLNGNHVNSECAGSPLSTTAPSEKMISLNAAGAANIKLNLPNGDSISSEELNEKPPSPPSSPPINSSFSGVGSSSPGVVTRPRSASQVSARSRLNTATTAVSGSSATRPSVSRGSDVSSQPPLVNSVHYASTEPHPPQKSNTTRRRRRATTRSSKNTMAAIMDIEEAERLLGMVTGHLVLWPHDWLSKEQHTGNWLYSIDQLAPIEIYD